MYERFTDRARKVMQLASQASQRYNHEYIGTEHILLGLVKEGSGVGANVLKNLDIDLRKICRELEKLVLPGPHLCQLGKLPQTPRAKKVIEYSIEEARNLNHNYVGTEHLLLGLLREEEGVAAQVLMNLGLNLDTVRSEVLNLLGQPASPPAREVLRRLRAEERRLRRQAAERPDPAPAPSPPTPPVDSRADLERLAQQVRETEQRLQKQNGLLLDLFSDLKKELERRGEEVVALRQQMWKVRLVLGTVAGALSGGALGDYLGAVLGLAAGALVGVVGRPVVGALAAVLPFAVLGNAYLGDEGGAVVGAALGVFLGACVGGIGSPPRAKKTGAA